MRQAKPTQDDLYQDLRRRLPGWAFGGLTRVRVAPQSPIAGEGIGVMAGEFIAGEPASDTEERVAKDPIFGGLCETFEDFYGWLEGVLAGASIGTASGDWLDLHGVARGIGRGIGEDDATYRARLMDAPNVATAAAIRAAVNRVARGGDVIVSIDPEARTVDCGAGAVTIDEGAIVADGDGTLIGFEGLAVGDHISIDSQLPDGRPIQWVRRLVYVFTLRERETTLDQSYLDQDFIGAPVLPLETGGPILADNGRNVAVVVTPPQMVVAEGYLDQIWLDQDFFGGTWEDADRNEMIRQVAEATAAAGIVTLIWIQEAI